MINTRKQLLFETRNTSNYKVGNNIFINRLSSKPQQEKTTEGFEPSIGELVIKLNVKHCF